METGNEKKGTVLNSHFLIKKEPSPFYHFVERIEDA